MKFSDNLKPIIQSLRQSGHTDIQIANILEVSTRTLFTWEQKLGIDKRAEAEITLELKRVLLEIGNWNRDADEAYRRVNGAEPPADLLDRIFSLGFYRCPTCSKWRGMTGCFECEPKTPPVEWLDRPDRSGYWRCCCGEDVQVLKVSIEGRTTTVRNLVRVKVPMPQNSEWRFLGTKIGVARLQDK